MVHIFWLPALTGHCHPHTGGYQLVGRTLPIWNTFGRSGPFTPAKPWLLQFFDQVKFYLVSEAELEGMRAGFATGQFDIDIRESTFDVAAYTAMVKSVEAETAAFKVGYDSAPGAHHCGVGISVARGG